MSAVLGGLVLVIMLVGLIIGKIDLKTFTAVLSVVAVFISSVVGLVASDAKNEPPAQ